MFWSAELSLNQKLIFGRGDLGGENDKRVCSRANAVYGTETKIAVRGPVLYSSRDQTTGGETKNRRAGVCARDARNEAQPIAFLPDGEEVEVGGFGLRAVEGQAKGKRAGKLGLLLVA